MKKIFKFRGIEVANLYECCDGIWGEATGHGLFITFVVNKFFTNERIDMWLASTKINSSVYVVKGAIRKRSYDDFKKAIHKAVVEYLLDQDLTPYELHLQSLVDAGVMPFEQYDKEVEKFINKYLSKSYK